MSSRMRFLVGILSLTVFNWLLAGAQNGAQNDYLDRVGIPDFTVADPVESGFINLANGGLHLEIPMAQLAQRGKTPFSIKLVYDSQVWGHSWPTVWYPNAMIGSMSGWRVIISGQEADGSICQGFVGGNCTGVNASGYDSQCTVAPGPVIGNYTTITGFTFTDATGVSKTFSNFYIYSSPTPSLDCPPDTPNGEGPADDDSGYYIKVTNYNQAIVYDSNGNQVFPVEDTNGNIYGTNGNGIVDLNGRNPVIKTVSGNNIYYDVLNSEGGRSRYTLTTVTNNVHTAFGVVTMTEYAGTLTALQSLTLPNGRSYLFGYDSGTSPGNYGLLTSMTLPSGGQVQYGYSTLLDSHSNNTRWLTSRISQGSQWTYALSGGGGLQQVTALRPDGTSVAYTFSVISGIQGAWPTSSTFNDAQGNIIQTVSKDYITHGVNPSVTQSPSRQTTSLPTGISKKTEYSWSFPNVTEVREWDFYSGTAPATPTRVTDATYTASNSTYSAKHILSKPTRIIVKNGAGTTVAFQANFEYDNYTAGISASGAVQHDPAFNAAYTIRGNLTAVQRWLSTDGSWLTTRNQYDDAGNIVSTTDPGLHTTTFSYVDAWGNSTCSPVSGNAAAFRTMVTNAKSQVQHSTYNSCTGTLASSTDVNNNTTNLSYADSSGNPDPLDRLIQTLLPPDANGNRAKKTTTYNESALPLSVTNTKSITTTQDLIETDTLDNLGRTIQAAVTSDPQGTTYALTTFDSLGRKYQTFNPTRCNPPGTNCGESTWGYVSHGYDVLNRPTIEHRRMGEQPYIHTLEIPSPQPTKPESKCGE